MAKDWVSVLRIAWFALLALLLTAIVSWRVFHQNAVANGTQRVTSHRHTKAYYDEARRIVSGWGSPVRAVPVLKKVDVTTGEQKNAAGVQQKLVEVKPLGVDHIHGDEAHPLQPKVGGENAPAKPTEPEHLVDTTTGEFKLNEADEHHYPTISDWANATKGVYKGIKWRQLHKSRPRITLAEDILNDAECQSIIDAANASLARSEVVHAPGTSGVNSVRTSYGMFLNWEDQKMAANLKIRKVVATLVGCNEVNIEATQVLRYMPGQFYRAHPDYFAPGSEHLKRGGQRFATLLFWLNDVKSGGETRFPSVNVAVQPKKGSGVMFYSMDEEGHEDPTSYHEGVPPGKGEVKWVAVSWVRQHEFH